MRKRKCALGILYNKWVSNKCIVIEIHFKHTKPERNRNYLKVGEDAAAFHDSIGKNSIMKTYTVAYCYEAVTMTHSFSLLRVNSGAIRLSF